MRLENVQLHQKTTDYTTS